jgi:2-hydroxy-6-oxonona-2,4-dienedioate hydrolase
MGGYGEERGNGRRKTGDRKVKLLHVAALRLAIELSELSQRSETPSESETRLKPESRIESRFIDLDGFRVHFRCGPESDGTPFVLIPGLVISSVYWIPLAEYLSQHSPVVAIDLLGFGRSVGPRRSLSMSQHAAAISRWMAELGIESCHLVGNSMGCQIAAHLAVREPNRVETLTLIGPTIDPRHRWLPLQVLKLISDAFQEPPRLWASWFLDFLRAGPVRPFGTTRMMFRDRIEKQLPRITSPTLVLRGEHDTTAPDRWAKTAVELLLFGEYIVIPGQAHCAHFTAPDRVAAEICSWIGARAS